jgi:hypothetical protein
MPAKAMFVFGEKPSIRVVRCNKFGRFKHF